jgi:hypothetical protein
MTQLEFDQIQSNWKTYENLCSKVAKHGMGDLLEALGERLIMCPASPRESQYGAYSGGLVEHALAVTSNMRKLVSAYDVDIGVKSVLMVGLLHDLGKVGDLERDFYVEQESDWHREKLGQFYKYNENLSKMSITHQTLFLLQHFGVTLTRDEWIAIQLSGGSHFEENRFYVGGEPTLAVILQQAKQMTIHSMKKG